MCSIHGHWCDVQVPAAIYAVEALAVERTPSIEALRAARLLVRVHRGEARLQWDAGEKSSNQKDLGRKWPAWRRATQPCARHASQVLDPAQRWRSRVRDVRGHEMRSMYTRGCRV